jgi:hypothetical protein
MKTDSYAFAIAQRISVLVLWAAVIFLMLTTRFWYVFALIFVLLVILHFSEIKKYGIPVGEKLGYSKAYSVFLTLVFGISWHRTVGATHPDLKA